MKPLATELDEATVAYVLETRKAFEDLRQVAAQLAGLLVLEAAGARSGIPGHPMLKSAVHLHAEAADAVQSARATPRARRHHESLLRACSEIRAALAAARDTLAIDPILIPVRAAYAHLQAAGAELPGFEMVSFEHGCCAVPMRSTR